MKAAHSLLITLALAAGPVFAQGDGHPHSSHAAPARQEAPSSHAAPLGAPGDAGKVTRTVAVSMSDAMRFTPATLRVKKGETIRFVVKNTGRIKHEMVLGTVAELKEHAAVMTRFPEMEHDDPNAISVDPGQTGELIWAFSKAGKFDFACLVPGHFEAGMRGKISVSSK